jgi:peptidyl-prolyl cis-trans isomerase C
MKEESVTNRLLKLLTEPLLQFLLIGACIYGAYALFGTPEEDFRDTRIHVDANRINGFISQWEARWNRPPTRQEIDGLIQSYIREDVLYRQAVTMGLNEDDPVTRRRMAQKLEFLTSDLALMVQPAEGELEAFFMKDQALYQQPDRITFSQVFFNPDNRGNRTLEDAAQVLTKLQAAGDPEAESMQVGDQFMLQSDFVQVTELEVARQLGNGFSEAVMKLQAGQWHGPVLSGYGVHLVYVFDFQKAAPVVFEDVKTSVLENWQVEQRENFNADFLQSLKQRYDIVIDEIPAERILNTPAETASIKEPAKTPGS